MGSEASQINPAGLAHRLVQDGLLSEARAQSAQGEAAGRRQPFVQYLVEQKLLDSHSIAVAASEAFGVPLLDLLAVDLLNVPLDLVDARLVQKHRALPLFRRGNRLFVAVSDPTNDLALDEIRFNTDLSVSAVLVEDDKLATARINQVNMNMKTGLTFAAALRAFLRQDPDILMVGEIRDLETAEIAVKAAQTGHLVLSTLHTNDAPQSLTRLANMGVPPFNIASSVLVIMAQRLARRLCIHCRAEDAVPRAALLEEGFSAQEIDDGMTIYKAVGCERCTEGYKGRVGIFQVVEVSEAMGRTIMEGGNALDLAAQAQREGFPDLRQSGLEKVKQGVTSLIELNRVTRD